MLHTDHTNAMIVVRIAQILQDGVVTRAITMKLLLLFLLHLEFHLEPRVRLLFEFHAKFRNVSGTPIYPVMFVKSAPQILYLTKGPCLKLLAKVARQGPIWHIP